MTEQRRSFHKKRKWVCWKCGMAKMERIRKRGEKSTN
jgi:ribosomal protein L37E